MAKRPKSGPQFRNIGMFTDLPSYVLRFPPSALVSLLHRVSGLVLFLLLPLIIWAFDASVSSEASFDRFVRVFEQGVLFFPGWFLKLVTLLVLWSFLHHLIAGLRFIWLDSSHSATEKKVAMKSAWMVLGVSVFLTVALGFKLFGLY